MNLQHHMNSPTTISFFRLWQFAWLSYIPTFAILYIGGIATSCRAHHLSSPLMWGFILGGLILASCLLAGLAFLLFSRGGGFVG